MPGEHSAGGYALPGKSRVHKIQPGYDPTEQMYLTRRAPPDGQIARTRTHANISRAGLQSYHHEGSRRNSPPVSSAKREERIKWLNWSIRLDRAPTTAKPRPRHWHSRI